MTLAAWHSHPESEAWVLFPHLLPPWFTSWRDLQVAGYFHVNAELRVCILAIVHLIAPQACPAILNLASGLSHPHSALGQLWAWSVFLATPSKSESKLLIAAPGWCPLGPSLLPSVSFFAVGLVIYSIPLNSLSLSAFLSVYPSRYLGLSQLQSLRIAVVEPKVCLAVCVCVCMGVFIQKCGRGRSRGRKTWIGMRNFFFSWRERARNYIRSKISCLSHR